MPCPALRQVQQCATACGEIIRHANYTSAVCCCCCCCRCEERETEWTHGPTVCLPACLPAQEAAVLAVSSFHVGYDDDDDDDDGVFNQERNLCSTPFPIPVESSSTLIIITVISSLTKGMEWAVMTTVSRAIVRSDANSNSSALDRSLARANDLVIIDVFAALYTSCYDYDYDYGYNIM